MTFPRDINKICRMCLTTTNARTFSSIFNETKIEQEIVEITVLIENCVNLKMSKTDTLPKMLCRNCVKHLIEFHKFRTACHANNLILHEHYNERLADEVIPRLKDCDSAEEKTILQFETVDFDVETNAILNKSLLTEVEIKIEPEEETNSTKDGNNGDEENVGSSDIETDTGIVDVNGSKNDECSLNDLQKFDDIITSSENNLSEAIKSKPEMDSFEDELEIINKAIEQQVFKEECIRNAIIQKYNLKDNDIDDAQEIMASENFEGTKEKESTESLISFRSKLEQMEEDKTNTFKCELCFEKFDNRDSLKSHKKEKHYQEINKDMYTVVKNNNRTAYICTFCQHFCKHKDALRVHLRKHTGEKPYKCEVCDQHFAQKRHVVRHMNIHRVNRGENNSYKCKYCSASFNIEQLVTKHVRFNHPDKFNLPIVNGYKNKLCEICGKKFSDSTRLQDHIRMHTGQKIHKCVICGKMLSSQTSLSLHIQIHSPEKHYHCSICGTNYRTKYCFTLHTKLHEQRNHMCMICNKSFLDTRALKQHLKVHPAE